MKLRILAVALAASALVSGLAVAQDTSTERGKLSYAVGYDLGRNLAESGESIDINTVIKALQDGFGKKDPTVPVDQLRTAVQAMQQRQEARAKAAWDEAATQNKTRSDQFLAQNRGQSGVQQLAGGVQYRVLQAGRGAKPTANSTVEVEVSGPFAFGQRPQQVPPAQKIPELKMSDVDLAGVREALLQMPAGSQWQITLPPEKAYGAGNPAMGIPPNVAVQFDVKLISVK